ncbi:MAG: tyrosine--tRNA ligase [Carbonactinosporaceae bacterium]
MTGSSSTILDDLAWRGLIAQSTDLDALGAEMARGPVTVYDGFDPTAISLHTGNLVGILTLRRLQQAGHRVIALVGGGTGLIGDPGGKTTERALNDTAVVEEWVARIRTQLERFLDLGEGATAGLLVNNHDWIGELSAISLLRDVGKHFSVNQMLGRETVRARLEGAGMSYTEFSYVVLQAYDYLQLHRRYGCTLQVGGSDQWGNIIAGIDLIRRVTGGTAHALTTPLLTKGDGTKFGKTEAGTVWLDPELTSPYAFYQFWVNADDRDIGRYLRVFSFRSQEEIEELDKQTAERPAARAAQRLLAEELTALVHGTEDRARVVAASRALFGQGRLEELDAATLDAALRETANARMPRDPEPTVVDMLVETGLAASKSAARRTIGEGGAYVNNRKISDVSMTLADCELLHGRWLVLRRGKRRVAGVEVA